MKELWIVHWVTLRLAQYFTNDSFFPTEEYTSFIRMEMSIVPWSKRGSGKTVISTSIMFCLLWWPFSQSPPLKAGQREWALHVFTALLRELHFPQQFTIIYQIFLGSKAVLIDGVKREGVKKTHYPESVHLSHISGKVRKGELFNIVWFPVLLLLL